MTPLPAPSLGERLLTWLTDHFGPGCDHCGEKFHRKSRSEPKVCVAHQCGDDWCDSYVQ